MADSAGEYLMQSWLLGARLATEIQKRYTFLGSVLVLLIAKVLRKHRKYILTYGCF